MNFNLTQGRCMKERKEALRPALFSKSAESLMAIMCFPAFCEASRLIFTWMRIACLSFQRQAIHILPAFMQTQLNWAFFPLWIVPFYGCNSARKASNVAPEGPQHSLCTLWCPENSTCLWLVIFKSSASFLFYSDGRMLPGAFNYLKVYIW